jgi:hypothetical protein
MDGILLAARALVRPGRSGRSEPRPARLGRLLMPGCPTHRQPQGSQASGPPLRPALNTSNTQPKEEKDAYRLSTTHLDP